MLGIDGATMRVIKPNIEELRGFKRLMEMGESKEIILKETPISASIWCGMFCGKKVEEHGHRSYVVDGKIVKREDIKVDFIWDILHRRGKRVKVINVPFVVPPYSFGVDFKPIGFGLPTNEREWWEELRRVTEKTKEALSKRPDLLISVYTLLDRVQHFHWGEKEVVEWYKRLDERIEELIGYLRGDDSLIVISDHGFCHFGEAKVQTLPRKTEYGELKGDHDDKALLITKNVEYEINEPQDVFFAIKLALEKEE
ncbi:MAG: alkaline phosphatase family protein [Candidatus Methanospirareceae archaeon]